MKEWNRICAHALVTALAPGQNIRQHSTLAKSREVGIISLFRFERYFVVNLMFETPVSSSGKLCNEEIE